MLVGVNAAARSLAYGIKKRGGALIIASHNRQAAHALAQQLDCRFVQFEALYSTMHDIVVVCDDEKGAAHGVSGSAQPLTGVRGSQPLTTHHSPPTSLHSGYLRPGMTVMDLTALPRKSVLLHEAQARDCRVVEPRQILLELALLQTHLIAGQDMPREPLEKVLSELIEEEE
jgi:3-dehydroquinate dehydratase/shikimate dehydrogenase